MIRTSRRLIVTIRLLRLIDFNYTLIYNANSSNKNCDKEVSQ